MKRIPASIVVFLATIAPAVAAETTDRTVSLPDANPECMQRNGPDCVLPGAIVPSREASPPGVAVVPPPVPPIIVPSRGPTEIAPAPRGTNANAPSAPSEAGPASPIINAPSTPTAAGPDAPAQRSTIISPRPK